MKRFLSALLLLLVVNSAFSQVLEPVKWEFSKKQLSENEFELTLKASIEDKWHLYAQYLPPENFSLPTYFEFDSLVNVELIDTVYEHSKVHEEFEELAGAISRWFEKEAIFTQKIKITGEYAYLGGYIDYMTCDDEQCIKLDKDFEFVFGGVQEIEITNNSSGQNYEQTIELKAKSAPVTEEKQSLWLFFFIAFIGGLLTLITPCVFPIIPMTVSFFMHGNKSKASGRIQALFYGFSIVLIYTIPILVLTLLTAFLGANVLEADFANTLSTGWFFNILFTLIFLIFAASFFGMFEITMPSWMVNKADKNADKGGFTGSFFMAFTLVLVSFSCTGPIVGTIIVQSLTGLSVESGIDYSFLDLLIQYGEPTIGMLGFSLGLALPFTLFAIFPQWLKGLPKSGGWLNTIKVVLGFLELALALKFLSVSDQAYHWGILDRDVYIAAWIVIFGLMGLYLLGKIKFAHDSDIKYLSVPRLSFAIITLVFVVYLIPGLFGAPLKALSGYLPPMKSHDFDLIGTSRKHTTLILDKFEDKNNLCETPKYNNLFHLPHGIKGYFDYEQGLKCAKELNKPIFIDFTGHGCVNCREMEANVWSDPQVLKRLNEEYIVIALYVDDKTELLEENWVLSRHDGKLKKTIGKKWADFQIYNFKKNAQPYYVLLDHDGGLLGDPKAYDLNVDSFVKFLDDGLKEFENR